MVAVPPSLDHRKRCVGGVTWPTAAPGAPAPPAPPRPPEPRPAAAPTATRRAAPAPAQQLPPGLQPAAQRPKRTAQLPSRLAVRPPLQAARQHRRPVLLRQPPQLRVDQRHQLARRHLRQRVAGRARPRPPLDGPPPRRRGTRLEGQPVGGAVEPAPERLAFANGGALRARARNVAWKTSSASWGSASAPRATRSTIGPWRRTRASSTEG